MSILSLVVFLDRFENQIQAFLWGQLLPNIFYIHGMVPHMLWWALNSVNFGQCLIFQEETSIIDPTCSHFRRYALNVFFCFVYYQGNVLTYFVIQRAVFLEILKREKLQFFVPSALVWLFDSQRVSVHEIGLTNVTSQYG